LFAIEAVCLDLLIDDARRNPELFNRLPQQRKPAAHTAAPVDILAGRRPDGVDESAISSGIGNGADGSRFAEREIDRALHMAAHLTVVDMVEIDLGHAFGAAEARLVGD